MTLICHAILQPASLTRDQFGLRFVMFGPEFAGGDQDLLETTLTTPL